MTLYYEKQKAEREAEALREVQRKREQEQRDRDYAKQKTEEMFSRIKQEMEEKQAAYKKEQEAKEAAQKTTTRSAYTSYTPVAQTKSNISSGTPSSYNVPNQRPVGDQKSCGSCWAWAIKHVLQSILQGNVEVSV